LAGIEEARVIGKTAILLFGPQGHEIKAISGGQTPEIGVREQGDTMASLTQAGSNSRHGEDIPITP